MIAKIILCISVLLVLIAFTVAFVFAYHSIKELVNTKITDGKVVFIGKAEKEEDYEKRGNQLKQSIL